MSTATIQYRFTFEKQIHKIFDFTLDLDRLELIAAEPKKLPFWTHLEFYKCRHCPFAVKKTHHCPLAVNLVEIVDCFEGMVSYDKVYVEVLIGERQTSQHTTVQRGMSSLMGLLIATSRCPYTDFFKPMARFHQPLADEDETIYRALSTYLMAQYFKKTEGLDADLNFDGLTTIYRNMQVVNTAIAKRLRAATSTDSSVNAIVLLDILAQALPFTIKKSLENIRDLFEPFLVKQP
jgi:hypothetical protein